MKYKLYTLTLFCLLDIIFSLPGKLIFAQDSTQSLAFKRNRVPALYPLFYTPDLSYQLKQQFQLIKMANSGDPLAQHEMGLRYLQGLDFPTDTLKAAEWIKKAALQDLPSACYNYAILLLNGWGVQWDPFQSFLYFKKAAEDGMPAAQYITGIFYTENLIVKKDSKAALEWLNKAGAKEYEPALELLKELNAGNGDSSSTDRDKPMNDTNSPLVFIDFEIDTATTKEITEIDLLKGLSLSEHEKLISSATGPDSLPDITNLDYELLNEAAESGSPEALTLIGYLYENGKYYPKDLIRAGNYYYRAAKLDSRNAIYLLWNLNNKFEFYEQLEPGVKNNDAESIFLLYGVKSFDMTDLISETQGKELLLNAASQGLQHAIVESGVSIYSGKYENFEPVQGIEILRTEMKLGNRLAEQRYISIKIIDSSSVTARDIQSLFDAEEKGSILAVTLLGFCYEKGLVLKQDYGMAVRYFRRAAQRGSTFAFERLKDMHDSLRPEDDIFSVN